MYIRPLVIFVRSIECVKFHVYRSADLVLASGHGSRVFRWKTELPCVQQYTDSIDNSLAHDK